MPVKVILPKLGSTMTRGTITRWFKAEGDLVNEGEPLFEFETDKAVMEVEARQTGILGRIFAPAGATVPVAYVVALILEPGEKLPEEAPRDVSIPMEMPRELPAPAVKPFQAQEVAESLRTTAQVTLTTEADATELVKWHDRWEESFPLSYNEILVKIIATALPEHPQLNSTLTEKGIHLLASINVRVAMEVDGKTIAPVIKEADKKDIIQIARELREKIERARAGKSLPEDLSGGSFTLTNLGMYEIDAFTPIIHLPECAILGVGRILAKPVFHQNGIEVRQMMSLSLSFDHRLVDGAPAARFLQHLKSLIENPITAFSGKIPPFGL